MSAAGNARRPQHCAPRGGFLRAEPACSLVVVSLGIGRGGLLRGVSGRWLRPGRGSAAGARRSPRARRSGSWPAYQAFSRRPFGVEVGGGPGLFEARSTWVPTLLTKKDATLAAPARLSRSHTGRIAAR